MKAVTHHQKKKKKGEKKKDNESTITQRNLFYLQHEVIVFLGVSYFQILSMRTGSPSGSHQILIRSLLGREDKKKDVN